VSRCERCGNRECRCGIAEQAQVNSLDVLLRIEALLEAIAKRVYEHPIDAYPRTK
jgi:hypothetical protein